jgi:hypothetical protein
MSLSLEDASKFITPLIRQSNRVLALEIYTVPRKALLTQEFCLNSEECRDFRPYEKGSQKFGRVLREYIPATKKQVS